jgi:(2R)-ethylmalonyl-CoA mutase
VDLETAVQAIDTDVEALAIAAVIDWRANRDEVAAQAAIDELREQGAGTGNLMEVSLRCARAGVTTGEWAGALRDVFGEYRAPTGVSAGIGVEGSGPGLASAREAVRQTAADLGGPLRFLVGKPGLDGHSNGAEQIAVRARDAGFEVVYQGIRLTPAEIVTAAVAEDVDVVGLSILSGSHRELVPAVIDGLRAEGLDDIPVVVGGIIPLADAEWLAQHGVAAVFTPKDYDANEIMKRVVAVIRAAKGLEPVG